MLMTVILRVCLLLSGLLTLVAAGVENDQQTTLKLHDAPSSPPAQSQRPSDESDQNDQDARDGKRLLRYHLPADVKGSFLSQNGKPSHFRQDDKETKSWVSTKSGLQRLMARVGIHDDRIIHHWAVQAHGPRKSWDSVYARHVTRERILVLDRELGGPTPTDPWVYAIPEPELEKMINKVIQDHLALGPFPSQRQFEQRQQKLKAAKQAWEETAKQETQDSAEKKRLYEMLHAGRGLDLDFDYELDLQEFMRLSKLPYESGKYDKVASRRASDDVGKRVYRAIMDMQDYLEGWSHGGHVIGHQLRLCLEKLLESKIYSYKLVDCRTFLARGEELKPAVINALRTEWDWTHKHGWNWIHPEMWRYWSKHTDHAVWEDMIDVLRRYEDVVKTHESFQGERLQLLRHVSEKEYHYVPEDQQRRMEKHIEHLFKVYEEPIKQKG